MMPLPITPTPAFPNVPQAPGVPPLLRQFNAIQAKVTPLVADAAFVVGLFLGPRWGLFTSDGAPAFSGIVPVIPGLGAINNLISNGLSELGVSTQVVAEMEYSQDNPISTAPQEQGAFVSYNKVSRPFNARVTYVIGGLAPLRGVFFQRVVALQNSLTMLNLVMPEYTYTGCNLVHHDFRRTQRNGVTLIAIDMWVEQVRVTGTVAFSNSNTKSPSGADPQNDGQIQPQPPKSTQVPPPVIDVSASGNSSTSSAPSQSSNIPGSTTDTAAQQGNEELIPIYNDKGQWIGFERP